MSKNKRARFEADLPNDVLHDHDVARRPRRASRLGWFASRLLVMLVLLAILARLRADDHLHDRPLEVGPGIGRADLASKMEIGSLSLAWWSPVSLSNLVVRDKQGTLAEVPQVRSHKTLWQLAAGYPDLGTFEITEPRANVILREDGSNVEDFLAKLPKDESKGKGGAPIKIGLLADSRHDWPGRHGRRSSVGAGERQSRPDLGNCERPAEERQVDGERE